jgi:hypothetical protein
MSLTEKKSKKLINVSIDTGNNIDDIVEGLIKSINDSEKEVQEMIHKSIINISKEEPLMTLSKALVFLNTVSTSKNHRVLIMNVISEILYDVEFKLSSELGDALIIMAILEIHQDKVINKIN